MVSYVIDVLGWFGLALLLFSPSGPARRKVSALRERWARPEPTPVSSRPDFTALATEAHERGHHALALQYELLDIVWVGGSYSGDHVVERKPVRTGGHYHGDTECFEDHEDVTCAWCETTSVAGTGDCPGCGHVIGPKAEKHDEPHAPYQPSHCERCNPARERMLGHLRPTTRAEYQALLRNWVANGGKVYPCAETISFTNCARWWTLTSSVNIEELRGEHALGNILVPEGITARSATGVPITDSVRLVGHHVVYRAQGNPAPWAPTRLPVYADTPLHDDEY